VQCLVWIPILPEELTIPPKKAGKLCALNLFFDQAIELPIYYGNYLLTDNKFRKLFITKQSKGCKFMPKMHQNTFGGRTPSGPTGGAYALPRSSIAAMGVPTSGLVPGSN